MWLDKLRERWQAALEQRGPCPSCTSKRVWFNGLRLRKASVRHGEETVFIADIPVRRLRCGDCVQRWSVAPEGVVSAAHYQPCVVAPAVAADVLEEGVSEGQVARACGCARRTVGRWVRRVARLAEPGVLARHLAHEAQSPVLPLPPQPVKARRFPARRALGERAVLVLALLEALASLRGLAPPGLAHAAQLVPALAPASGGAM
jgi:transposase-like protein